MSCTNIDKKDCAKTHWPTQGFEDGKVGRPSRISMFLAKCSPHNVNVESTTYLESYEKGLDQFCSDESAFSRGFQSLSPEAVCAEKVKYKKSYDYGMQSFCTSDLGQSDALIGKSINNFCNKKTIYLSGYQSGLKKFCTAENAYKIGADGKLASEICKGEIRTSYEESYKNGRRDFLKKDTLRLQNEIKNKESKITLVKDTYTEKLSEAYEIPKSSEDPEIQEKISNLDKEIKSLKEERSKIEQAIFDLQKLINANNSEIGQMD